jgi:hypothetical protein
MRLRPQRIGSSVYVYREGGGVALSVPCAQGTAHATIELCRPWWFRGPHLCVVTAIPLLRCQTTLRTGPLPVVDWSATSHPASSRGGLFPRQTTLIRPLVTSIFGRETS